MKAFGCKLNTLIPILREKEFEIASYVMGYHDYKNIWKPTMEEKSETRMGPDNIVDKFTMALVKSETVVGLIMKWKTKILKTDLLLLTNKDLWQVFCWNYR